MKRHGLKLKLVSLMALTLAAITLLSSCGGKVSLKKVMNEKYDFSDDFYSLSGELTELEGMYIGAATEYFAKFKLTDDQSGVVVTKVFSFSEGKVVATFTNDADTRYDITFYGSGTPVFIVSETERNMLGEDVSTEYTLYNTKGEKVEMGVSPLWVVDDLFIFDNKLYEANDDGNIEKLAFIPEYVAKTQIRDHINDRLYAFDRNKISVYDLSFDLKFVWEAPGNAESIIYTDVLNNGNIFSQYMFKLPDDTKKYDLYHDGAKYDLVTVIVDVKSGKEKEIKADFLVSSIKKNFDLYDDKLSVSENKYTDSFENIATITYIVDKKVDASTYRNTDLVLMDNNGKINGSLRAFENQGNALPGMIGKNRYIAYLKTGENALIDSSGKVISTFDPTALKTMGGYLVSEEAVYDLDLNKVYDLDENDATVMRAVGNTLFIKKEKANGLCEIISLRGRKETTVFNETEETMQQFFMEGAVGYYVYSPTTGATHYNANGMELLKTAHPLSSFTTKSEKYGSVILSETHDEPKYYLFEPVEVQE